MKNEQLEKLSLEQAFDAIDDLCTKMSGEDIDLDESFELYKDGMQLLKYCTDKIDNVEKKVKMLNSEGETDEF